MTTNVAGGPTWPTLAINHSRGHCAVSLCEGTGANSTVRKPTRPEVEEPPKVPPPPPKEPPEPPEEPPKWPPEPPEPPEEPPEPEKRPRIREAGVPPLPVKVLHKHRRRALRSTLKAYGVYVIRELKTPGMARCRFLQQQRLKSLGTGPLCDDAS
jgi:hypothetical protein